MENLAKIRPFGFDYYATYKGSPLDDKSTGLRSSAERFVKDITGYSRCFNVDYIEGKANKKDKDIKILFMTRLWDPAEIVLSDDISKEIYEYRQYMIEERKIINARRIEIVRELRGKYGENFFGGIQPSEFASRECPDIVISKSLTNKKNYLDRMKASDICIGSTGLHKSTGWKTGEYVAAARAIVAERLEYDVPGNFAEGVNYIPFDDVEGCLAAIEKLYNSPESIYEMKKANEEYYKNYLRPDVQILNALKQFVEI